MVGNVKGPQFNISNNIQEYSQQVKTKKTQKSKNKGPADMVNISSEAKRISQALSQPVVRENKVSEAKIRVKQNYYSNKTAEIANNILKDIFG